MAQPNRLELQSADGRTLQLEFAWRGDRFEHTLRCLSPTASLDILSSVEGDAAEAWPDSPPLQQLHVESRDTGEVALLVGMAGKSHWSASVEATSAPLGFRFDLACRMQGQPQRLTSSYTLSDAISAQAPYRRERDLVVRVADGCGIVVSPWETTQLEVAAGKRGDRAGNAVLVVKPIELSQDPPCTQRWGYDVQLSSS